MSAERKIQPLDELISETEASLEPFALKQQVAERLAAHRARRTGGPAGAPAQPVATPRERNSRIAAAVAERYSQSKSYRAFLAEEAERAVREAEDVARQAEAAAEIAARNAEAVAQVQYDLLAELDGYAAETTPTLVAAPAAEPTHAKRERSTESAVQQPQLNLAPEPTFTAADLTVRLASELRRPETASSAHRVRRSASPGPAHEHIEETAGDPADPSEALFLDDEIAFRQAPVFEPVEPPIEIPANLIEFPRQLIASRRARPRLAEGPLREEGEQQHDPSQLRIFEVETEQLSPDPAIDSSAPEWSSILLDAHPRERNNAALSAYGEEATRAAIDYALAEATVDPNGAHHLHPTPETQHLYAAQLHVAPVELRAMSAAVDACVVLAGSLIFDAGFVVTASHFLPDGLHLSLPIAAISAGGTIVLLALLYLWVFFTFSEATLGMRYARIGLCTFTDENPTRSAMRRRIFASVLSTACCGLGLLWTFLDDDRLGWHDRLSGMYQRSY